MERIFVKLLNMSISASMLILAVLVLRLLFRKAPRWFFCLLWGLVAVRLLCPVSFSSPFSAYRMFDAQVTETGEMEYVHFKGENVKPIAFIDRNDYDFLEMQEDKSGVKEHDPDIYLGPVVAVWIAGMLGILLYAACSVWKLKAYLGEAVCLGGDIWISDTVKSSFIFGLLRPRIYIGSGIPEEQREYVIAHERAHLKRGDHLWKLLGFVLLCIYWFNPLCWLSYILFCKDMELACDEKVIKDRDMDYKRSYSATLLECSMQNGSVRVYPLAFGEVSVKERVKNILRYKKPAFVILPGLIAACVVLAVGFLTIPANQAYGASKTAVEEPQEQPASEVPEREMIREEETADKPKERKIDEEALKGAALTAVMDLFSEGADAAKGEIREGIYEASSIIFRPGESDGSDPEGMTLYMRAIVDDKGIRVLESHPALAKFDLTGEKELCEVSLYRLEELPDEMRGSVVEETGYSLRNGMNCHAQIRENAGLGHGVTFAYIGRIMDLLCMDEEGKDFAYFLQTYDEEKHALYTELIWYGEDTLAYRDKFRDQFSGLRKELLEHACEDIEGLMQIKER